MSAAPVVSGPTQRRNTGRLDPSWAVTLKCGHRVITQTFWDEAQAKSTAAALRRRIKQAGV